MDITPLSPIHRPLVTGYGNGGFKINQEWIGQSVLLLPDHYAAWEAQSPADITPASLASLLEVDIDLLLIGTGKSMAFISPGIKAAFKEKGIALDAMDTGAACRTYNVLAAEERRVAAALLAI